MGLCLRYLIKRIVMDSKEEVVWLISEKGLDKLLSLRNELIGACVGCGIALIIITSIIIGFRYL